jgi:cell wall-associated NlpC family hydrolase
MKASGGRRDRGLVVVLLVLCLSGAACGSMASSQTAEARGKSFLLRVRLGARPLKPRMRGTDVRSLQRALTRLKQRTSSDGVYGKGTYESVRGLERRRRWRIDGRVGRGEASRIKLAVQRQRARRLARAMAGKARLQSDGTAVAPPNAPIPIREAIDAANRIHTEPYVWGGGHGSWNAKGYDCSGAVSYVLHAAGLLSSPMTSGGLTHWGYPGTGQWITVDANKSHAWMTVAGLRFDTSSAGESWNQGSGPRWRVTMRSGSGYAARYSPGL